MPHLYRVLLPVTDIDAALSHRVWSEASPPGRGWTLGLAQALGISIFGVLLLRARNGGARGAS